MPRSKKALYFSEHESVHFVDAGFSTSHWRLRGEVPQMHLYGVLLPCEWCSESLSQLLKSWVASTHPLYFQSDEPLLVMTVWAQHIRLVLSRQEGRRAHCPPLGTLYPWNNTQWMDVQVLKCTDSSPFWTSEWVLCLLTHNVLNLYILQRALPTECCKIWKRGNECFLWERLVSLWNKGPMCFTQGSRWICYFINKSRILFSCSLGSREYAWETVRRWQEVSSHLKRVGHNFLTSIPLGPPQIQFYQTQELQMCVSITTLSFQITSSETTFWEPQDIQW